MDDFRPSSRSSGGDKRLEIVSGKGFNSTSKPHSPDKKLAEAAPKTNRVASSTKSWKLNDPEMRRKKRIVKYKVYSIEGKFKASIKKSFRWIKNKCSEIIHGY